MADKKPIPKKDGADRWMEQLLAYDQDQPFNDLDLDVDDDDVTTSGQDELPGTSD